MSFHVESEALAYWYLRLNGFLTTTNFVVHPDQGRNQETDADILGVRFPFRAENLRKPIKDDSDLVGEPRKSHIVIAEVKSGRCGLNGPWTKPERRNMLRVLSAIGAFESGESESVAKALYDVGHYSNQRYRASLLCFGRETNPEVAEKYPAVPQILWPKALSFIYGRFRDYRNEKLSHPQWDQAGHALWNAFESSRDESTFTAQVNIR